MTTDTPAPTDVPEPMLELALGIDPEGHATATLPVRWRLNEALLRELDARRFGRPCLLITVRHRTDHTHYDTHTAYDETGRWVVPLSQAMAFINFTSPGDNQVVATVINVDSDSARERVDEWVKFKRSETLYHSEGKPTLCLNAVSYIDTHAVQNVEVDPEMFAPEPPRWAKWVVGMFFESKPHDQCHFRRRLLISTLVFMPLLLTLGVIVRVVMMAAYLLAGMRNIDWRWLEPLNMDATPRHYDGYGSIWIHDKHGFDRKWYYWMLNPITLVGGPFVTWFFISYVVRKHHGNSGSRYRIVTWDAWHTVMYVDAMFVGVACIGFCLMGLDRLSRKLRRRQTAEEILTQRVDPDEAARRAMMTSLRDLMLVGDDMKASVNALPRRQQTLRLRAQRFKSNVCRPFVR